MCEKCIYYLEKTKYCKWLSAIINVKNECMHFKGVEKVEENTTNSGNNNTRKFD